MAIRITGMYSGLDTESIISELASAQSVKKNKLVKAQTKLSWKQDAWKALNTKIYSFYTNILDNMRFEGSYMRKSTKVSHPNAVSIVTSADAPNSVQNASVPYALLCVACVYALTLKLTAGLILLLTIKPAYMLLREKRWKEIGIFLAMGLMVAVPWMARTVLITGWLLYPFVGLDLFDVGWKIKEHIVAIDAYLIKVWAKSANALEDTSLKSWVPYWFRTALSSTERLLIVADLGSCAAAVAIAVSVFIRKNWKQLDYLLVIAAVGCSYLYWQFNAPMIRYGYAYVLLLAALVGGYLLERLKLRKVVYLAFVLYGVYKLHVCWDYVVLFRTWPNYVWSETYETYEVESYTIEGVTFYYSPFEGPTGYDPFPSAPTQADLEFLGDELKDGFRSR